MSRNATFFVLALIAVCSLACQPAGKPTAAKTVVPQTRATVITIRTSVKPENRTWEHSVVIAGDRARSTGELDSWHLYDLKANTVTFVDDVGRTVRTEPLALLQRRRKLSEAGPLPSHFPPVKFVRTDQRKVLQGATAARALIESGQYRRELWFAEHPAIPPGLFALIHASEMPSSPLAPMMQDVDEALNTERGFPLADRTVVSLGRNSMVIDRAVTAIVSRNVPKALFEIPRDYRDLTVREKKKP